MDTSHNRQRVHFPRNLGPHYFNQVGRFSPPGTFAFLGKIFQEVGGYDERLAHAENTDLALRLVERCVSSGKKVHSIQEPLVVYHREDLRYARDTKLIREHLESAEIMLEKHKERYISSGLEKAYSNYLAIAGVNAARLGQGKRARGYFARAILYSPMSARHYLRYLLSLASPIGKHYWKRHEG